MEYFRNTSEIVLLRVWLDVVFREQQRVPVPWFGLTNKEEAFVF